MDSYSVNAVFTFEAGLTNDERAVVHSLCRKRGMKSKSSGKGDQRRLSVYNNKRSVDTTKKDNFTSFTFSEEAKDVLRDLFTRNPPDDRDMGEKMDGKPIGKCENRKKDDFFYKPSMNKVEIVRKVESLASVVEKTPKLRQINQARSKLPIASFRDVITSTIESHQVVLISGETGCGKTTQVPQYLLDYMWDKGKTCKIVCTQPRRISAISIAERISSERGETVGDSVGYKIRLESKGGRNSSIVFCTNGVLLRVLVSKGSDSVERKASRTMGKDDVSDITHIIVDEIHERDRFSDLMLAILRDTLPSYPHLRVVLMSATLDAERFSQYFGGCPIIRVPGFTYPVQSFYLEDVLSLLKSTESNHPDFTSSSVKIEESKLTKEDRVALDEAIDLAWSYDEFDPLVDLISSGGSDVVSFQHSSSGVTPLMAFARKGRVNDICMLLSFGADCHARAKDGTIAVEWAQRENQREAVEILEKHMDKAFASSEEEKDLLDKYLSTTKPEEINVVLIESLLKKICTDTKDGAILIFLPGWDDINKTRDRLQAGSFKDSSKFVIISLHSMVPSVEQKKVFKRPPHGCRKIVLSTNIAETAVTIDDVVYVIDSGRMKEKNYDPYNNVSTLNSSWISKASAKQREGRAGRCQPGVCYHLYSKLRAASLIDFQVPEIRRIPIEELCLQVKILDPDCKIDEFLQKTLDPPVSETIRNAITVLQDIGALSPDEKLTDLGNKIGSLPVHPLTSKMLFVAILTNCLDPALTLACASDYKDSFTLPILPSQKKKAEAAKFELSLLYGGYSDQLAVVAAFECWKNAKAKGQEPKFCSLYYVSSGTMKMLFKMRKQLQSELHRNGFIPDDASVCNVNAHNPGILRTVLVAGQYPMVGRLLPKSGGQRSVVETAGGNKVRLHPQSTNFMLAFKNSDDRPLIIHDEVTRVDSGLLIRNCSLIGPLPLLMLATEIIVAPAKENEYDGGDHNEGGSEEADEDNCDESKPSVRGQEIIMSTPHNPVKVIVDRWLSFESTAIDVAQIYCLRERLSKAIMHKVTHPRKDFPELLGASIKAITAILSSDAMLGIRPTTMVTTGGNGQPVTKGTDQNPSRFLESLIRPSLPQNSALNHKARPPAPTGMENLNYPSNPHPQPPLSAAFAGPYQNYPAGAFAGLHQNYPAGAFAGQHQNYPSRAFASPHQNYPAGAFAGPHQNHTSGSFASPHQNFHAGALLGSDQNLPAGTLNSYQIINDALAYLSQVSSGAAPFPSEFFASHGPTLVSGPMPGVHGPVAPSAGPTPPRAGGSLKRRRCNKL